jgi:hypothetical protein
LKKPLLIIFIALLVLPNLAVAQFAENITSGRPGNANGPFSVGKGVYQVQFGQNFLFANNEVSEGYRDSYAKERMINGPDVLFRIGLKEDFELRIGGIYTFSEQAKFEETNETVDISGLNRILIGFRQTLYYQKAFWPTVALQFTSDFGGVDEYQKDLPDAILRLNLANRIGPKLNLNWNFISRWVPDETNIVGFYIFNFSYPLSDSFTISAEVFGDIDATTKLNGGMGLAYLLNPNFQLDLYGSYGVNEIEMGNVRNELIAINGGISYRIVKRGE